MKDAQQVNGINNFQLDMLENRVSGFISKLIAKKVTKLDAIFFEDSKILDEINKASGAAEVAPLIAVNLMGMFTFYLVYVFVMAFYLYSLSPILLWAILLAFIPKLIATLTKTPLYSKLENKSAPLRREYEFSEQAMTDRQFFKETRILGAFKYFNKKYLRAVKLLNRETWRTDVCSATIDLIMNILNSRRIFRHFVLAFYKITRGNYKYWGFCCCFW